MGKRFVGIIDRISKRNFLSSPTYIKKLGSMLYVVDTDKIYIVELFFSKYVEKKWETGKQGIVSTLEDEKTGSDGTAAPITDVDREIDPSLAP